MTFISYPNLSATSENGRFRIDIEGAAKDQAFRDQADFNYRLYQSDQLVWEWPPESESGVACLDDYPHEVWVSDLGWVVVRTHNWFLAGLLVLSPSGQVVLRSFHRKYTDDDAHGFLDDEPEEFMGDTSAGPFWSRCSLAYFFEQAGNACWAIRTWWGRRVVINLDQRRFLTVTEFDEGKCKEIELAKIQRVLAERTSEIESRNAIHLNDDNERGEFWDFASPILTAVYHAGWLNAMTSIPYLRQLETSKVVGSMAWGDLSWGCVVTLPFRQAAKAALLRLGQEPQWISQFEFGMESTMDEKSSDEDLGADEIEDEAGIRYEFPQQATERSVEMFELGLNQMELLQTVGAPEFVQSRHWEYDFLSSAAEFTARIIWNEDHLPDRLDEEYEMKARANPPRISKVEIIEPQWKLITRRDQDLLC